MPIGVEHSGTYYGKAYAEKVVVVVMPIGVERVPWESEGTVVGRGSSSS